MNNWINATVKHIWNNAIHVLHNFLVLDKHNSLTLGLIQPSPPTLKSSMTERDRTEKKIIAVKNTKMYIKFGSNRFLSIAYSRRNIIRESGERDS